MSYEHPITPIFRSTYSFEGSSLLTLEEPGKAKPGGALSVFDLAKEANLQEIILCDKHIDGYIQAYKVASKLTPEVKLIYGIIFTVVPDIADKSIDTRRSESKVIVLIKDHVNGYKSLVHIWNRAWGKEGNITYRLAGKDYSYGRVDWALLKQFWTDHLALALPFYGSFIERNTMTFAQLTPDLPCAPWVFREQDSGLPFEPLVGAAVDRYVGSDRSMVVPTKTICYRDAASMRAYVTMRAIAGGNTFDEPNVAHLASDRFSLENYLRVRNQMAAPLV